MRRNLRVPVLVALAACAVLSALVLGTETVSGRVTDADGRPVAGAVVRATFLHAVAHTDMGTVYQETPDTRGTKSGADGRYRMRLHGPFARLVSFVMGGDGACHVRASSGNLGRVCRRIFVKTAASRVDLQLGPPGTELTGRLVDSRGRCLADQPFSLLPRRGGADPSFVRQDEDRLFAAAYEEGRAPRTDERGRLGLCGIPPGCYEILVWRDGALTPVQDGWIEAVAGKSIEADFRVLAPEDMAELVAEVVDEAGAPLPEFQVVALRGVRPNGGWATARPDSMEVMPGQLHATGLEPGEAQVLLAAPGLPQTRFQFHLDPGTTGRNRFILGRGGSVSGTVTPFLGSEETSVGCRVRGEMAGQTCVVGAGGAFSSGPVAPGEYLLVARNRLQDGVITRQQSAWMHVGPGSASTHDFDLSDGPAEVGGEIRLPANAPGGWILVREPKAPPVTDWHDPVGRHDGTVATMPVKDQHTYRIPGLPEGEYIVSAFWMEITDAEAAKWREGGTLLHQRTRTVRLKGGESARADFDFTRSE